MYQPNCGIGSKEKLNKHEIGMYECWQVPSLHYLNLGVQVLMTQTQTNTLLIELAQKSNCGTSLLLEL
jgi:hypothetical protein